MSKKKKDYPTMFPEGNYTVIPNDLLEAVIQSKMNGTQIRLVLHLVRKTFGWRIQSAAVSLSDFAKACRSAKAWISPQINVLVNHQIMLQIEKNTGRKPVYRINTCVAEWDKKFCNLDDEYIENFKGEETARGLSDNGTPSLFPGLSDNRTLVLSDNRTPGLSDHRTQGLSDRLTPDTVSALEQSDSQGSLNKYINKSINKGKETQQFDENSNSYILAKLLHDRILLHLPHFKTPDLTRWSADMEKMMRIDKRDFEEAKKVIIFAQDDEFWRSNILCAEKLRLRYDTLNSKRLVREKYHKTYTGEVGDDDEYDFFFKR